MSFSNSIYTLESNTLNALKKDSFFNFLLLQIDCYSCVPNKYLDYNYDQFSDSQLDKVPILRLYGTDDLGNKVCLHMHNVYPYLYIPMDNVEINADSPDKLQEEIIRLGLLMNAAIAQSQAQTSVSTPKTNGYVVAAVLVKGISVYGFHSDYSIFLKVYLSNQYTVYTLAELLRAGAVDNRKIQPFESHLPFDLQFMIDYNLVGMGTVYLKFAVSRKPNNSMYEWPSYTAIKPSSTCCIELDAWPHHILNRKLLQERETEPLVPWGDLTVKAELPSKPSTATVPSVTSLYIDEQARRAGMNFPQYSAPPIPERPFVKPLSTQRLQRAAEKLGCLAANGSLPKQSRFYTYLDIMTAFQSVNCLDMRFNMIAKPNDFPLKSSPCVSETFFSSQREALGLLSEEELRNLSTRRRLLSQDWLGTRNSHTSSEAKLSVPEMSKDLSPESKSVADFLENWDQESLTRYPSCDQKAIVEDMSNQESAEETLINNADAFNDEFMGSDEEDDWSSIQAASQSEKQNLAIYLTPQKKQNIDVRTITSSTSDMQLLKEHPEILRSFRPMASVAVDSIIEHSVELANDATQQELHGSTASSQEYSFDVSDATIEQVAREIDLASSKLSELSSKHKSGASHFGLHFNRPLNRSSKTDSDISTKSFSPLKQANAKNKRIASIPLGNSPLKRKQLSPQTVKAANTLETTRWKFAIENCKIDRFSILKLINSVNVIIDQETENRVLPVLYTHPFYSNSADVPPNAVVIANSKYRLKGNRTCDFAEFPGISFAKALNQCQEMRRWRSIGKPLSRLLVKRLISEEGNTSKAAPEVKKRNSGRHTFAGSRYGRLITLALEVHVNTRGKISADPKHDRIGCIVFSVEYKQVDNGVRKCQSGVICLEGDRVKLPGHGLQILTANDERMLLGEFVKLVRAWDPDVLMGFQIATMSLGYLCRRAQVLGIYPDLAKQLSRVPPNCQYQYKKSTNEFGGTYSWDFSGKAATDVIAGRTVINCWRVFNSELSIRQNSFESCVHASLDIQTPLYTSETLTRWYKGRGSRFKTIAYHSNRIALMFQMMRKVKALDGASEFARIFGVSLASVLARGSQYKVESLMCRLARPENWIMASPGANDMHSMNAAEAVPLVLEPESKLYTSPVIVVDFQSLYPSIMIAYNYCYSTCLGKVTEMDFTKSSFDVKLGTSSLQLVQDELALLAPHINIAPNGVAYVKSSVRRGILERLLTGILNARVMVKQSMKQYNSDHSELLEVLDSRQLSLKYIANVTYGYTSAAFSGRMPCVDIADSIVSTGRLILETAIQFIHSNSSRWGGARVVYGDTDSLFILVPHCSRAAALAIGRDIVDQVSNSFPHPIQLKLEKVYLPCVLQSKKRYVGYAYSTDSATEEPIFDAKGIETVRRDGCEAASALLEQSLRILFDTMDLSKVKEHVCTAWTRILLHKVSMQPFTVARAVSIGRYRNPPPGAIVAMRKMVADPCAEPQRGNRVPFLVVSGPPKMRLMDSVQSPEVAVESDNMVLHANYYITKQMIPPLARVFSLFGVDVALWYQQMPKIHRANFRAQATPSKKSAAPSTIDAFYASATCIVCGLNNRLDEALTCRLCKPASQIATFLVAKKRFSVERQFKNVLAACQRCSMGISDRGFDSTNEIGVDCHNLSCPVYFEKYSTKRVLDSALF